MRIFPSTSYVVVCEEPGCNWRVEHTTKDNARLDGERHHSEWHQEPEPVIDEATIVGLMETLERSLAAIRADRRSKSTDPEGGS